MNEEFFAGFDSEYIFYDNENEFLIHFSDNGICEVSENESVTLGKWRFVEEKKILEIYIPEDKKIRYKVSITKKDDKENDIYLQAKFIIKYENGEDDKKGDTSMIRSVNKGFDNQAANAETKVENFFVVTFFFTLFLILISIASLTPFFNELGIIYLSVMIIIIEILLIKKIRVIVKKFMKKYESKIKEYFFA